MSILTKKNKKLTHAFMRVGSEVTSLSFRFAYFKYLSEKVKIKCYTIAHEHDRW